MAIQNPNLLRSQSPDIQVYSCRHQSRDDKFDFHCTCTAAGNALRTSRLNMLCVKQSKHLLSQPFRNNYIVTRHVNLYQQLRCTLELLANLKSMSFLTHVLKTTRAGHTQNGKPMTIEISSGLVFDTLHSVRACAFLNSIICVPKMNLTETGKGR